MVRGDSSLHCDDITDLGVGMKLTQDRGQLHGVNESMERTLAPGRRHCMGCITHEDYTASGQAVEHEIAPDMWLLPDPLDGCQFEDLSILGRQFCHGLEDVVQLLPLAGRLEPVLGMADIVGVWLHEHPEETTRLAVREGVVQPDKANEAQLRVDEIVSAVAERELALKGVPRQGQLAHDGGQRDDLEQVAAG